MKTEKIAINKSAEQPAGIEIELLKPENALDEQLLGFLLPSLLRELKQNGKIPYDLPAQIRVNHRGDGTFIVAGFHTDAQYYEPPRPLAIIGLRTVANGNFDLIHAAPVFRPRPDAAQPAQATEPAAAAAPAPESTRPAPESTPPPNT